MPRGDGTGPMGMGPMTGRAAGFCAGYNSAGARGRGRRNCFFANGLAGWQRGVFQDAIPTAKEQELESLKAALENLNKRIKELETTK